MGREHTGRKISQVAIDTDVLIWYLRGHNGAQSFLSSIPAADRLVPAVVAIELLQGCRSKSEVSQIFRFIERNFAGIAHLDEASGIEAISLMRKYGVSHGLRTADALIAGLVITRDLVLATGNSRHFRYLRGLRTLPFSPDT